MQNFTYDDPNDISSVELIVQAASGNTSPIIYANGRNQLKLEIIATAKKKNNLDDDVMMNFSDDTWMQILSLRHAESDKELNWNGSSGWCYTFTENEYSRELITSAHAGKILDKVHTEVLKDGRKLMAVYVYTDDVNVNRIAVSIDTSNGKHYTTADNANGDTRSSVKVSAIQAVSYHNGENISIIEDSSTHISDSLHYTSHILASSYDHYNGQALRTIFRLKSKLGHYFLVNDVSYKPLTNSSLSSSFDNHWNVRGFGSISEDSDTGKPCSVIGYCVTDESYDVYMWYSRKNRIAFRGGWLSERWTAGRYYQCYFRTQGIDVEDHTHDDENGEVTILLYTFRCWEYNTNKRGWADGNGQANVHVVDNYGNEGVFKLNFHRNTIGIV